MKKEYSGLNEIQRLFEKHCRIRNEIKPLTIAALVEQEEGWGII